MKNKTIYLGKSIYVAAFLMFGCSSSGVMGCGGDSGPTVDSELVGIYRIDRYQSSEDGCDQPTDVDPAPAYLVLYGGPSSTDPEEVFLVGQFCSTVDDCRQSVQDFAGAINWSFFTGSDETGWQGWGISRRGSLNDQCQADVQRHILTSTSASTITIDTTTVEAEFMPTEVDGSEATCSDRVAIETAADQDQLPCIASFLVEATFEERL